MAGRARIRPLGRRLALFAALACFVLTQAAWTVPLHALTHCRATAPAPGTAQPDHAMDHSMHAGHAMHEPQPASMPSTHECCPPSTMTTVCTHPANMDMAQCATGQTCCRIEQGRRVPKYTSSAGVDRSADLQQPLDIDFFSSESARRVAFSASPPHARPVLDQKSDLRI